MSIKLMFLLLDRWSSKSWSYCTQCCIANK